jgi:hypothetical protein
MAPDPGRGELERLEKLPPEARARVEAALKAALEKEVVAGAAGGGAAANIFSRGWVFSRLTPTSDSAVVENLPGLSKMGTDEFEKFATRLAEIKKKTDRPR